jgi:hypothetical protein
MATLLAFHFAFLHEERAFEIGRIILSGPEFKSMLTWSDAPRIRGLFEAPEFTKYWRSILFNRIFNALDRLFRTQSTRDMDDYFRTRGELDAVELETGYAGVRYFIWLIPLLGLIGNVLGIGIGIASFAAVFKNAQDFSQVQQAIPIVTTRLGTAFDTTFLALVLSAIAVFYMSFLLKRQEQLLQRIDNICIDGVGALFQEHSSASGELIRAFGENVEHLIRIMNGNRGAIETVLRRELPFLIANALQPVLDSATQSIGSRIDNVAETGGENSVKLLSGVERLHGSLADFASRLERVERAMRPGDSGTRPSSGQ